MSDLPMKYTTSYQWQGHESEGNIYIESKSPLSVGTPHDLERFSPEHLLVATAEICLANYVLLIGKHSRLDIVEYQSKAEGELEKAEDRKFRFKRIIIRPKITVADKDDSLTKKVVEKAKQTRL